MTRNDNCKHVALVPVASRSIGPKGQSIGFSSMAHYSVIDQRGAVCLGSIVDHWKIDTCFAYLQTRLSAVVRMDRDNRMSLLRLVVGIELTKRDWPFSAFSTCTLGHERVRHRVHYCTLEPIPRPVRVFGTACLPVPFVLPLFVGVSHLASLSLVTDNKMNYFAKHGWSAARPSVRPVANLVSTTAIFIPMRGHFPFHRSHLRPLSTAPINKESTTFRFN